MADFDLGYFYYLHDKNEEAKDLEQSGSGLMYSGLLLVFLSLVFLVLFRNFGIVALSVFGVILFFVGRGRKFRVFNVQGAGLSDKKVNVELHGSPYLPVSPFIVRERFSSPFSEQMSLHLKERERIRQIIVRNSGSDISAIYTMYHNEGGVYDAERFVKSVHSLKRHGLVSVTKTFSQTSFIPSVST